MFDKRGVKAHLELGEMQELPPHIGCYACDPDNPDGLHIRFFTDGEAVYGEYVAPSTYQGYGGVLHGGILTTLLDEAMAKALVVRGITAVTGKIEVRFRNPAPTERKLLIKGWVKSQRRSSSVVEARITDENGQLLAEGQGLFFPIPEA